jgi:hypothetical protein
MSEALTDEQILDIQDDAPASVAGGLEKYITGWTDSSWPLAAWNEASTNTKA